MQTRSTQGHIVCWVICIFVSCNFQELALSLCETLRSTKILMLVLMMYAHLHGKPSLHRSQVNELWMLCLAYFILRTVCQSWSPWYVPKSAKLDPIMLEPAMPKPSMLGPFVLDNLQACTARHSAGASSPKHTALLPCASSIQSILPVADCGVLQTLVRSTPLHTAASSSVLFLAALLDMPCMQIHSAALRLLSNTPAGRATASDVLAQTTQEVEQNVPCSTSILSVVALEAPPLTSALLLANANGLTHNLASTNFHGNPQTLLQTNTTRNASCAVEAALPLLGSSTFHTSICSQSREGLQVKTVQQQGPIKTQSRMIF